MILKKEFRLLTSIPDEEFLTDYLCAKMLYHNNDLVLIPLRSKKIWRYNLKTNTWSGVYLKPLISSDGLNFSRNITRE